MKVLPIAYQKQWGVNYSINDKRRDFMSDNNKKVEEKAAEIIQATETQTVKPAAAEDKEFKKKKSTTWERNQRKWGWAFILPTMIGIIVLNLWPIVQTIYQSFCKVGSFGDSSFAGFANYKKMFADPEVWQSLLNTFKYAIIEVPFSIAIALILAVFLNRKMHGRTIYRAIFFLPMVVPFVWMTLTAFKTVTEATSVSPFVIFPSQWRTDAFTTVWNNMNFLVLYKNTLLLIFFRVVCACLTATLAGYAFARLKFKGRDFMFSLILFQMMIPSQIFIIPQFLMISKMGMTNTMFALVFPGIVTAFGTFLLKQAYMGLPGDLEEAARLDGCNIPKTFVFVMAPLARSSMVALGIFTAVFAFKDLMWPLVVNSSANKMPLSAALATMQGQYQSNYPQLMAASLISCIPMIVIYLIFQKQFVEGIATSGGKL